MHLKKKKEVKALRRSYFHYVHFTDEETKVQAGVTFPKLSDRVGLKPRQIVNTNPGHTHNDYTIMPYSRKVVNKRIY